MPQKIETFPLSNVLATYKTTSTGNIRLMIKLPFLANSSKKLSFVIDVYSDFEVEQYIFSGYLYINNWYNAVVTYLGKNEQTPIFGRDDDGYSYVSIMVKGGPGVTVRDVNFGSNAIDNDNFNKGWTITRRNDTPNIISDLNIRREHFWYSENLPNPIQGIGSAGYLPKFTGEATLGNSVIYETGGGIAIGKASVTSGYRLDVNGATAMTGLKVATFNGTTRMNSGVMEAASIIISNSEPGQLDRLNGDIWVES